MKKIDIGSVVQLKAGGPKITVDRPERGAPGNETGRYWCQWFEGSELQQGKPHPDTLQVVDEGDPN